MSDVAIPANTDAAAKWWVQVRGRAYGPYTMAQLAGFVEEGRVRPATSVSDKPEAGWVEARRVPGLMTPPIAPAAANDRGPEADLAANVFVFAEIFSGAHQRFLAALEAMGVICDLAPGLWLVRTRFSSSSIRNTISQTLDRGDRFVVIDATRDRLAWFNLGPETDVRIGHVWNQALKK